VSFQSSAFRDKNHILPRFSQGWPSHSHPHSQRVESLSLSFLRSALHNAHDRIHIVLLHSPHTTFDCVVVLPDAGRMSFDCQTNPSTVPHRSSTMASSPPGVRDQERSSFAHTSLCQSKPNRFANSYQGLPFRGTSRSSGKSVVRLRQLGRRATGIFRPMVAARLQLFSCTRSRFRFLTVVSHSHAGMHTGRDRRVAPSLAS